MAAINYYIGLKRRNTDLSDTSLVDFGTASTAADIIELRMEVQDAGNNPTGLQRIDVAKALIVFLKYLKQGGQIGDGTNIPIT